jgi:hypothetical protein
VEILPSQVDTSVELMKNLDFQRALVMLKRKEEKASS